MTVFGYARVSTTGQTLATQKALLKAAGVERIFTEKVSGVAARRPELERVLDQLEPGDLLVVTKLDRLARSTLDLLRMVDIGRGRRWVQISRRALGPTPRRRPAA
jgi:DNA invertase Pin-like site-specific DNA recombinase